jgi:hypothetical protein
MKSISIIDRKNLLTPCSGPSMQPLLCAEEHLCYITSIFLNKMRKRNIYILYLPLWNVLLIVLSGCLNKYEKDIVGNYEVKNYELTDSTKTLNFTLPKLLIKKDKTFLLSFDETKLEGKWEADDFGDWTLATLFER